MPLTAPGLDELEVSVFGPGVGECIVVHLGNNEWVVVDSCIHRDTKRPVALDYLDRIGVSPLAIRQVIISHWDDDHIKGISELVKATPDAEIVLSSALQNEDFQAIVAAGRHLMKPVSATEEIWEVIQCIKQRTKDRKNAVFQFASANNRLYQKQCPFQAEIWSLSPTPHAVLYALQRLKTAIPAEGATPVRLPTCEANHTSIVLWIRVASRTALLGGDLENVGNGTIGWQAIVSSTARPMQVADFYKVPHHGSDNAYSSNVWTEMLMPAPWAFLTPMRRAGLPTEEDIARLKLHTDRLWISAPKDSPGKPRRSNKVERQLKVTVCNRIVLDGTMGHIRYRASLSSSSLPPSVQAFPPALAL